MYYWVVTSESRIFPIGKFTTEVDNLLADGWQPLGGISSYYANGLHYYQQALIWTDSKPPYPKSDSQK